MSKDTKLGKCAVCGEKSRYIIEYICPDLKHNPFEYPAHILDIGCCKNFDHIAEILRNNDPRNSFPITLCGSVMTINFEGVFNYNTKEIYSELSDIIRRSYDDREEGYIHPMIRGEIEGILRNSKKD